MTVQDIYQLINSAAPFDAQEEWDNSGILVGSPSAEVSGVLFALDVTDAVIEEAVSVGASLIVTHHPLMFSGRKRLTDEDYEGRVIMRLIREGISLIAAHTCLDRAEGGMNDVLAALCGLADVSGEGFFRAGNLTEPLPAAILAGKLEDKLGDTVRIMGPAEALIRRVGLCSGGGSEYWEEAARVGCDAFIAGEIRHHHALAMAGAGVVGFECGHFHTEEPGIRVFASALQKAVNTIECNVRIYVSGVSAYSFPRQP